MIIGVPVEEPLKYRQFKEEFSNVEYMPLSVIKLNIFAIQWWCWSLSFCSWYLYCRWPTVLTYHEFGSVISLVTRTVEVELTEVYQK